MDEIVREAEQLFFKSKDYCDAPSDPKAQQLQRACREFYDEAKRGTPAEKLEWKIKDLRQMVESFKHSAEIYDFDHIDDMHDRCEDMRKTIEKLARQ